jgi:catechol 1,2-dioxygenase
MSTTVRNLTAEELTDEVVRRLEQTPDPRLREIMCSLVRHLHDFAREVRLTEAEWMRGIEFPTAVGQKCSPTRQEFILLSDTLGVSSLVDLLTQDKPEGATESTVLGPFYVPDSPKRANGESIAVDDDAEVAVVSGRVLALDGTPIAGATIDVWQTNSKGWYAVQQPGEQPAENLRGLYTTDADGRYEFRTVRPVEYPVPVDGPVGPLLEATARHPWRAAHIHAIVDAPGFERVVTHIFDGGRQYLDTDVVFGVKPSLIRQFTATDGPDGRTVWTLEHDFVLVPERG